ncbi:DnaJ family domain-containing protein [Desulfonatronospira sp.]|uniref:DnaJ family domain-containing protein n=1 Tax=Desulfonatronospira sp. TaxID=1962951 RepID=UPI0025BB1FF2|nr:DnaJ family domain-containing protein [Desulfonatronospira sp.]
MDIFAKKAEERILEALEKGDFDNLPGRGKPLDLADDSNIPSDMRIAYKILKNAGYVPPEVQLQKEIATTRDLLNNSREEEEAYRRIQKLNLLVTRMNIMRNRPVNLEENQEYYQKIVNKVRINKK